MFSSLKWTVFPGIVIVSVLRRGDGDLLAKSMAEEGINRL